MANRRDTSRVELSTFLGAIDIPYVVMGVGIPGSGRSESLARLGEQLDIPVVSRDRIGHELKAQGLSDRSEIEKSVRAQIDTTVREMLQNGSAVIVDARHVDAISGKKANQSSTRVAATERYRGYGAKAVFAADFQVGLGDALQADPTAHSDMVRRLLHCLARRPVTLDEGFDLIARSQASGEPLYITDVLQAQTKA